MKVAIAIFCLACFLATTFANNNGLNSMNTMNVLNTMNGLNGFNGFNGFNGMNSNWNGLNSNFNGMNSNFNGMNSNFNGMNSNWFGLNRNFNGMNSNFNGMNSNFNAAMLMNNMNNGMFGGFGGNGVNVLNNANRMAQADDPAPEMSGTMIFTSADDPGKSMNYAVLGDPPIVPSGHVPFDDRMMATSGDAVVVAKGDDTMVYGVSARSMGDNSVVTQMVPELYQQRTH